MTRLRSSISRLTWKLDPPFVLAGEVWPSLDSLVLELTDPVGRTGRSEVQGVSYLGETYETMAAQIEASHVEISAGISVYELASLMPPGGARNAVDTALWDLISKQRGRPVYDLLGLPEPIPVSTAFTIGLMDIAEGQRLARWARDHTWLKIKVDDESHLDMIAAVRQVRPDARLLVDANQSWSFNRLREYLPELQKLGVDCLEQPLARGQDECLEGFDSPVLLMADESCQDCRDIDAVSKRYGAVNIKLDKTGGLTEALRLYVRAREIGLKVMVGNMCGGSLAMAPAYLLAQLADLVDLDGPLLQTIDWQAAFRYSAGQMYPPRIALWGGVGGACSSSKPGS